MSKKLTLLCGPPGSGKSTLAKQYIAAGFTYINQDLQGREHLQFFELAIKEGESVIVDRMSFSKSQRLRYLLLAKEHGYETEIIVLHQPYQVCLQRCLERKDHLTIKDERSARSALQTFFTKYERPTPDEADDIKFVYPEGDKPLAVISDLDGTLCNVEHRRHFVLSPENTLVGPDGFMVKVLGNYDLVELDKPLPKFKKNWPAFFAGMVDDVPNKWCVDILKAMSKEFFVVYCSGRPDNWRPHTVEWLKKHNLFSFENGGPNYDFHLYMRPRSDSRDDSIVKEIILDFEILSRFTPLFFIDDRQRVVDKYRSRGFTVLQCDVGNF